MRHVDLNTKEITELFKEAEIYAKTGQMEAVQITQEGLESGAYADKDVRLGKVDEKGNYTEGGKYVIDTYVMKENKNGTREAAFETTNKVEPGYWIITNPIQQEGDRENNFAQDDKKFHSKYEPTDKEGIYRPKGIARIIPNPFKEPIEIDAEWGKQVGDENCYCCVPYEREDPDLLPADRYLLSENDFAAYKPAKEVLGIDLPKHKEGYKAPATNIDDLVANAKAHTEKENKEGSTDKDKNKNNDEQGAI